MPAGEPSAAQLISARIADLGDGRGDVLRRVRKLIKEADPAFTTLIRAAVAFNKTAKA